MLDSTLLAIGQFGMDNPDLMEFMDKIGGSDEVYYNIAHLLDNSYPEWRYAKGIGHSALDFFDIVYGKFECEGLDEEGDERKMAVLTKIVIDAYNPYQEKARHDFEIELAIHFDPCIDDSLPEEEYDRLYDMEWEEYLKEELEALVIPKM